MKRKGVLLCLIGLALAGLFISCQNVESADGIRLVNTTLKLSNLPYGSEGLFLYARARVHGKDFDYPVATVTSSEKDAVIEKTVKLPIIYDSLTLYFLDEGKREIFYRTIEETISKKNRTFIVDGKYYWYYKYNSEKGDFPACSEADIENIDLYKTVNINTSEKPCCVFKLSGVAATKITIKSTKSDYVNIYASNSLDSVMNYEGKLTGSANSYVNNGGDVYFLFSSKNSSHEEKYSVSFYTAEFAKANGLYVDKAILASDGNIYASGTNSVSSSKAILYCINPTTGIKTKAAEFAEGAEITCLEELDTGTIYVSYSERINSKSWISKFNLETKTVSTLVSDLDIEIQTMVNYKNGKLLTTGLAYGENYTTQGKVYLIDKNTGSKTALTKSGSSSYSFSRSTDLLYFPAGDFFIGHNTPYCYMMKIDNSSYNSIESSAQMGSPIRLYSTSPLQILDSRGKVYTITPDSSLWHNSGNSLCNAYKDCCISGSDIYYLIDFRTPTVEKCAISSPKTEVEEKTFVGERAIKLCQKGDKVYLLTYSDSPISGYGSEGDYLVYLRPLN